MSPERTPLELLKVAIGSDALASLFEATLIWGLAGALLGFLFGLASYKFFRRHRWYGATSTAGRWTQRGLGGFTLLVSAGLLGLIGLGEGLHRQAHASLATSTLGTRALPRLADEIADGLVLLDHTLQQRLPPKSAEASALLMDFRGNRREFAAKDFLQRFDQASAEMKQDLLASLETKLRQAHPRLPAGVMRLVRRGIDELGAAVLEQKISSDLPAAGWATLYTDLRGSLIREAARTGDPRTLTRKELSTVLLRDGLLPGLIAPLHAFIRQQQLLCLLGLALVCFLPALLCRLIRPAAPASETGSGG